MADLCKASLIFLCRPSLDTRFCSLEIVTEDWKHNNGRNEEDDDGGDD